VLQCERVRDEGWRSFGQGLVELEGGRELPEKRAGGPDENEQCARLDQDVLKRCAGIVHVVFLIDLMRKTQNPMAISPSVTNIAVETAEP
jgi:hypothetical protein